MADTNGAPTQPQGEPQKNGGKLSRKKVRQAIPQSHGIVSYVAKRCGVSHTAIRKFLDKPRNADIRAMLDAERDVVLDVAESKLFAAVSADKEWAVKFTLSTIGRTRGYQQLKDGGDDGDKKRATVNIFLPDNGRPNNNTPSTGSAD